MEKHLYNVSLHWKEGRKGVLASPEIPLQIEVATPPEFDKGIPGIWSPEHFFTASVLSCFMTTFLAIADYSKLDFSNFDCSAKGILEKIDGKFIMSEVNLMATLEIGKDEKPEKAERILHKSENACLISNSIKSKVNLECTITHSKEVLNDSL